MPVCYSLNVPTRRRQRKPLAFVRNLSNNPTMQHTPVAVLADIHGNSLALKAVLEDARKKGVSDFVNLGDIFYGPLDPTGTWEILSGMDMPTILGNQDRILLEGGDQWEGVPAYQAALAALEGKGLEWLRSLPATVKLGEMLLCHGTPANDMKYLLEDITTGLPAVRECEDILKDVLPYAADCSLVLAGHSHHPGQVHCGGFTLVNPGSVGLPAYDDDTPPHIMASGSPHAKYAIVKQGNSGWDVDFISVQYDWSQASAMAKSNGREDWAQWLLTGMV